MYLWLCKDIHISDICGYLLKKFRESRKMVLCLNYSKNRLISYAKIRLFYLGLIHGQINLIKFVESNKFDNVAIWQNLTNFLFSQIS